MSKDKKNIVQRLRVAKILRRKAEKTTNPRWKDMLEFTIYRLEHCRCEIPKTGLREQACKSIMCPAYMTLKYAVPITTAMRAHFQSVHPHNLYFVRLTLHRGRVMASELASARHGLMYDVVKLTQSRVWRRTFLSWGGTVHLEWKPASQRHGHAGFVVHIHFICEADGAPEIDAIASTWVGIIGKPASSTSDYFYFKHVKKFEESMTYVSHVENLIPGYKEDRRGRLLLARMPLRDIFAFLEATTRSHRLLRHGFNVVRVQAAVLKAKEERAAKLKARRQQATKSGTKPGGRR
jgi:hypothetical protein